MAPPASPTSSRRVYEATRSGDSSTHAFAGAKYLQAIARTDGDICLIQHNQPDGLDLYYLGWCHGPVGTARSGTSSRSSPATGSGCGGCDKSAQRADRRAASPNKQTPGFWNNVSQCCGIGRRRAILPRSSPRAVGCRLPRIRKEDDRRSARARHARRKRPALGPGRDTASGPSSLVAQTGYMQGAAGIGVWLLRLDAAETGRTTFIRLADTPF